MNNHKHLHVFVPLIFRETGYTCYRCYEEDAKPHVYYRYNSKGKIVMDLCKKPKELCKLFQQEKRYSKYLRRSTA